jgi:hypothetical protein
MSVRTNLLSNPSARRGFGGYTPSGGTLYSEPGLDVYLSASGVFAAGNATIALEAMTIGAGKLLPSTVYTFSASIFGNATSVSLFAGGAGVVSGWAPSAIQAAGAGFLRQSVTFTTTASGAVTFYVLNSSTTAAGNLIAVRDALLEQAATVGAYFDGTYPLTYWAGTADNSTSTQYVPVVTLTPYLDANPAPRALVAITDTPPAAQTVNLYRTAEGRTMEVRGGVNLYSVGGVTVMDFEAPFGVPATYQAEMFTTVGVSLGFTNPGTVTLAPTLPDTSYVWVHQPLNPSLAIQASMAVGTAADVIHQSPGSVIFAEGATVGVRIGGQRLGITGMQLTIVCTNPADADEFLSMFGGYTSDYPAVLCIRSVGPVRIPRVFFASVAETHEVTDYSQVSPFITFALTVDEARPPTPGLVLPSLRMKDIDFPYATMNAQDAAYATNLAQDSDYSLAGVAGP